MRPVSTAKSPIRVALPIPVTVVTSVKRSPKESARQLLSADGSLVPGSVHRLQRNLRAWRSHDRASRYALPWHRDLAEQLQTA